MDEVTEHEVLYRFGWMQYNPTWRKEYELIQRLFTENQTLRKQIKALTTNESTQRIPELDMR
jgi:hypothetical protein